MRNVLLENFGAAVTVSALTLEQVLQAEEIFVCNSINGIWPVLSLQTPDETWHFTSGHRARQAQACFVEALV
jgi:4-amino-4-deoxychorismate lyase